jgi:hypothetical protein
LQPKKSAAPTRTTVPRSRDGGLIRSPHRDTRTCSRLASGEFARHRSISMVEERSSGSSPDVELNDLIAGTSFNCAIQLSREIRSDKALLTGTEYNRRCHTGVYSGTIFLHVSREDRDDSCVNCAAQVSRASRMTPRRRTQIPTSGSLMTLELIDLVVTGEITECGRTRQQRHISGWLSPITDRIRKPSTQSRRRGLAEQPRRPEHDRGADEHGQRGARRDRSSGSKSATATVGRWPAELVVLAGVQVSPAPLPSRLVRPS